MHFASLCDTGAMEFLPDTVIHEIAAHMCCEESFKWSTCTRTLRHKLSNCPTTFVHFDNFEERDLKILPEQIRHLRINCLKNTSEIVQLHNLPCTLQSLAIKRFKRTKTLSNLCIADFAAFLPRTLEYLWIPQISLSSEELKNLPNLLVLSVVGSYCGVYDYTRSDLELNDSQRFGQRVWLSLNTNDLDFGALPASLTQLNVHRITGSDIARLPPNLTSMSVSVFDDLLNDHIKNLPKNLTHLQAGYTDMVTRECLISLPKCLKTLEMCIPNLTNDSVHDLPSSLTRLGLGCGVQSTLSDYFLHHLPKNLFWLTLKSSSKIDGSGFASLSRSLTVLNLPNECHIKPEFLSTLPPYLTTLDISHMPRIHGHVGDLPRYLSTLDISFATDIVDSDITKLPRMLECLWMTSAKLLTDACIKDLPRGLRTWNASNNTNFTNACVAQLPNTLQTLVLTSNVTFTDEIFEHLPTSLQNIGLKSNTNVTNQGLQRLCNRAGVNKIELRCGTSYENFYQLSYGKRAERWIIHYAARALVYIFSLFK